MQNSPKAAAEDCRDKALSTSMVLNSAFESLQDTVDYCLAVLCIWMSKGTRYHDIPQLSKSVDFRVHTYARAMAIVLWNKKHYRARSWKEDMMRNLRNVALPGTGLPMSFFCFSKPVAAAFVLFGVPLYSLAAAVWQSPPWKSPARCLELYRQHLTAPVDWFSLWRVNCTLASCHELITADEGYALEDKWTFLERASANNIPLTPWFSGSDFIVKHRNEEGGLGIHRYKPASDGGEWIVQRCIENSQDIAALLPAAAPLSTLRLVTRSQLSLPGGADGAAEEIEVVTCVYHESIMFDVDLDKGKLRHGTSNANWYLRGWRWVGGLKISPKDADNLEAHPDTGKILLGQRFPSLPEAKAEVCRAHKTLAPRVPLIGWDVAVTPDGIMLLEANLSCNLFKGSYDRQRYMAFVDQHWSRLASGLCEK